MDIILLILSVAIVGMAQAYVSSTYNKYKKVKIKKDISGFEVARMILDNNGLNNIYVTETSGVLSDHYDSNRKVVRLSKEIFHGNSIASISVAAHEVGHAIQDKQKNSFMRIRSFIFPFVNFSSYLGYVAIMIGIVFNYLELIWIGIGLELVILAFQLVTLPVEFDASRKAIKELKTSKILEKKEIDGSEKMLKAAAFTYVAGVLSTILEILRLVINYGDNRNRK